MEDEHGPILQDCPQRLKLKPLCTFTVGAPHSISLRLGECASCSSQEACGRPIPPAEGANLAPLSSGQFISASCKASKYMQ